MKLAHPDQATAELVRLAQRELRGDSVLSEDAGFARLMVREGAAHPRFWGKGWLVGGGALVAAGALAAALWLPARQSALTFEVAGGSVETKSGRVVGQEGTRIRFSDGSEAQLSRGAEARVNNITEHGAEVLLEQGSMRVSIAKKPEAAWRVAAGPYDVRVTGTAFDVSWSAETQAFDLRMQSGAVIVTGPLAQSGIVLKAGQHLSSVAQGRLTVEGGDAPPSSSSVAAAEASPSLELEAADARPTAPAPGPAAVTAPRTGLEPHAWTKQVAQGHFNDVLSQAERRGMSRTLESGSLEELSALADAARYAGRSAVAKRVLLAQRQRFPASNAARDAAFFLGRLAEDTGGAVAWYERYVSESPRGAYASQAFGRKMMLQYKQRGVAAAQPTATDYLARYPNGPYAAAARKIDQEFQSAKRP